MPRKRNPAGSLLSSLCRAQRIKSVFENNSAQTAAVTESCSARYLFKANLPACPSQLLSSKKHKTLAATCRFLLEGDEGGGGVGISSRFQASLECVFIRCPRTPTEPICSPVLLSSSTAASCVVTALRFILSSAVALCSPGISVSCCHMFFLLLLFILFLQQQLQFQAFISSPVMRTAMSLLRNRYFFRRVSLEATWIHWQMKFGFFMLHSHGSVKSAVELVFLEAEINN